eukprot:TRINITY_DN19722_c0_g1_i1.p1 TRINITY_DN19722_c0_g1~~TRINITY_DN19722_c0_g1_i1.p1  ORF type:complete len:452 (+),score=100.60 TRINITY_DN19722_c0_g1_i1:80-1435(+)
MHVRAAPGPPRMASFAAATPVASTSRPMRGAPPPPRSQSMVGAPMRPAAAAPQGVSVQPVSLAAQPRSIAAGRGGAGYQQAAPALTTSPSPQSHATTAGGVPMTQTLSSQPPAFRSAHGQPLGVGAAPVLPRSAAGRGVTPCGIPAAVSSSTPATTTQQQQQQQQQQLPLRGGPPTGAAVGRGTTATSEVKISKIAGQGPPEGSVAGALQDAAAFMAAHAAPRRATVGGEQPGDDGTVLCFGDSLTGGINVAGHSFPRILEERLRDEGYKLRVQNAGQWGDCVGKMIRRFPYVLADACQRSRLRAVLILGGTNNLLRGGFYCSELVEVLSQLHEMAAATPDSPKVGVLTLPPSTKLRDVKEKARLQVNEKLRALCEEHSDRFLVDLEDVDVSQCHDGLHYTSDGYTQFAQIALEAMRPVLDAASGGGGRSPARTLLGGSVVSPTRTAVTVH